MLAGIIRPGIFLALLLGQAGRTVLGLVRGGQVRLSAVVEASLLYLLAMVAREDECGCDAHDLMCSLGRPEVLAELTKAGDVVKVLE